MLFMTKYTFSLFTYFFMSMHHLTVWTAASASLIRVSRLLVLGLGCVVFSQCEQPSGPVSAAPGAPSQAVAVEVESASFYEGANASPAYSGTLEAFKTTSVHFMLAGRVSSLLVKEGDYVAKGALLAQIETEDLDYALEIAETNLAQAKDSHRRLNEMYQKGNLAEKDIVEARTRLALAEVQVKQSRKALRETRLLAPESGILAHQRIEEGSMAGPEVPVFSVVTVTPMYAKFAVSEAEIGRLSKGQRFWVRIPALDMKFEGKVAIISPVADNTTRTYAVKVVFGHEDRRVLPGMIAEGYPDTSSDGVKVDSVLAVKPLAVMKDGEQSFVFVADPTTRKALKRQVRTGRITGGHVQIIEGLAAGEQVITGGNQKLREGQSIVF